MKADPAIVEFVRTAASSPRYAEYLREVLTELVAVDTAPSADLADTAARESRLFACLEKHIRENLGAGARLERVPIPARIAAEPEYSPPGYAADASGAVPGADVVYRDRGNLLVESSGTGDGRPGLILHAHVDVVPPWFPPRLDGQRLFGRGACDNKAQVAVLLAQMRLLGELAEKFGRPARGLACQFVIDEEIGGNGSLAMALDQRFAGLPVLMADSTDLVPYCAHRGCVYYRCRLSVGPNRGMSAVELFPFVVLALEYEGRKIKRETNTPGFTADHVQTSHGVLGPFGKHPGNVCDHVAVEIISKTNANPQRLGMKLTQFLEEALAEYVSRYGNKAGERDPATGEPKVVRHFEVRLLPAAEGQRIRVDIWGKAGHMAEISACDGAITKAALLFGGLLKIAGNYPGIQAYAKFAPAELPSESAAAPAPSPSDADIPTSIVLEGGQGFTPSHRMADIQRRIGDAAREAVKKLCKLRGRKYDASMVEMSFDRLHNDAYADPPEIAPMQALREACSAVGHQLPAPAAWQTSCDARIYHHRGHAVAIFGAGKLGAAHSDTEYVDLPDVQKALAIMTLATWSMIS